jgi:hypothetical protein
MCRDEVSFTTTNTNTITYYNNDIAHPADRAQSLVNWQALYAIGGIPLPEVEVQHPRLSLTNDAPARYTVVSAGSPTTADGMAHPLASGDADAGMMEESGFDFYERLGQHYDDLLAANLERDVEEQWDEWRSEVYLDQATAVAAVQSYGPIRRH